MPIRLSGMNSGLDTDAIVKELVSAYNLKTQKYQKAQTKLEWKQDAWKSLNTKIYSLYTNISSLRYSSAYNLKKTTVSDSTKAKVTASSGSVVGTQTLSVNKMAQSCYLTGAKLSTSEKVTSSTKLTELGCQIGSSIQIKDSEGKPLEWETTKKEGETSITEKVNSFTIDENTTVSDFVNALKQAGLNANFDEGNQRFFISAKESGASGNFTLTATDNNGKDPLKKLGLDAPLTEKTYDENGKEIRKFTADAKQYQEAYDAVKGVLKDELNPTNVGELKTTLQSRLENYNQDLAAYNARNAIFEISKKIQTKIEGLSGSENKSKRLELIAFIGSGENLDEFEFSYLDKGEVSSLISSLELTSSQKFGTHIENLKEYIGDRDANDIVNELTEENLGFYKKKVEKHDAFFEENPAIGDIIKGDSANKEEELENLVNNAAKSVEILYNDKSLVGSAVKIYGSDAEIVLNGATYTSSSNTFSINGLTIEAMSETKENESISITTATDTQGIYDKIKDFLTEYNNIINEMTKLYNADSAKNYEPLTSEEKEAMTEEEIEKWEDKIKDSLLRRDTTLNSVMSAMMNSMAQSIVVGGTPKVGTDGKTQKDSDGNIIYEEGTGTTLSLSSFGIKTLGFLNAAKNEQNAYHIDGDEDDANTSDNADKLMKAIQENADQVCEFMQRLATKLYSAVDKKMKSSSLSSAYKVYNDKEMDKQLKDYKDTISKWEEKVSEKEEYYYKKFSAMETALSKLQNQTNSLAGLIGGM